MSQKSAAHVSGRSSRVEHGSFSAGGFVARGKITSFDPAGEGDSPGERGLPARPTPADPTDSALRDPEEWERW
jgi:hypothetical protein